MNKQSSDINLEIPQLKEYKLNILHKSSVVTNALSVFTIIRDEIYFMPYFFEHYRRLGVKNFLVYDDGSTDGTLDFLIAQKDCTVVNSGEYSFGDIVGKRWNGQPKRFCSLLRETLPVSFFPNEWVLTLDADEFLVLPPNFTNLTELVADLEARKQFYVTAPMIDFYPEYLRERNYDFSMNPFDASPYFDAGPLYDWQQGSKEPQRLWRGVRARLIDMLNTQNPGMLTKLLGAKFEKHWAKLWKVPLIKNGEGIFRDAEHEINIAPDVSLNVALAHFKYYPGLDKKISTALELAQYFNASEEYKFLHTAITLLQNVSLISNETRKYAGPESLVDAGHIT